MLLMHPLDFPRHADKEWVIGKATPGTTGLG
jgi:hypothetical protein